MAQWRTRGYVADSDEEEDDSLSSATVDAIPSAASHGLAGQHDNLPEAPNTTKTLSQDTSRSQEAQPQNGTARTTAEVSTSLYTEVGRGRDNTHTHRGTVEKREDDDHKPPSITGDEQPLKTSRRLSYDEHDIDELEQDHYTTPLATSTGAKPDTGLIRTTGIREAAPAWPHTPTESLTSSLSSPPSRSSPLLPAGQETQQTRLRNTSQNPTESYPEKLSLNQEVNVVIQALRQVESQQSRERGRNLRHRNPIQLHPYAIESEKYRQVLKARGVKPLRIVQTQNETQNESQADTMDDTQVAEGLAWDVSKRGKHNSRTPEPLSSSSSCTPSASPKFSEDQPSNKTIGDEEFPDLDTLLRSHAEGVAANGFKRRKTAHTFSKKKQRSRPGKELDPAAADRTSVLGKDDSTVLDPPVSPPLSDSSHTSKVRPRLPKFRVPRGISPIALPTPVASSGTRNRPITGILESEDTPNDDDISAEDAGSAITIHSEVGSPCEQPAAELQQAQRKIRGVLPASWLKLDLKAQIKGSDRSSGYHRAPSFGKDGLQRGIARRKSPRNSPASGRAITIVLSDDEDSNVQPASVDGSDLSVESLTPRVMSSETWPEDHELPATYMGEVEEDNRIDEMLPTVRREFRGKRQRQSKPRVKLKGHVSHHNGSGKMPGTSRRRTGYQPKITKQLTKWPKKQLYPRPPKLSVLDTPTLALNNEGSVPRFLKVALRTARSRNDQGKQSISKKQLRLATVKDSREMEKTMEAWRKGSIKPRSVARSGPSRIPLADRAGNHEILPGQATDVTRGSKPSRQGGNTRGSSDTRSRKLQQTLDQVIARNTTTQDLVPKVRKFKFTTSHGTSTKLALPGQLLPSLGIHSGPRQAMLEGLQSDRHCHPTAFQQGLSRITEGSYDRLGRGTRPRRKKVPRRLGPEILEGTTTMATNVPRKVIHQAPGALVNNKDNITSDLSIDALEHTQFYDPQTTGAAEAPHVLGGLDHVDAEFSTSDSEPLPAGAALNKSTFIGSGDFWSYIRPDNFEAMDRARGLQSVTIQCETYAMGPWNETVTSQLEKAFEITRNKIKDLASLSASIENTVLLVRSIMRYFSNHLSFVDPIDRVLFLRCNASLLHGTMKDLAQAWRATSCSSMSAGVKHEDPQILLSMFLSVMVYQLHQVANHGLVPFSMKEEIQHLLATSIKQNLRIVLEVRFKAFRHYFSREAADILHQKDCLPIQAIVVSQLLLLKAHESLAFFWEAVNDSLPDQCPANQSDARVLEQRWHCILSLLPFLELNVYGELEQHRRSHISTENWQIIKPLIDTVFRFYNASPTIQHPSFNAYCRKLYARCFNLIDEWHWNSCNSILGTLFDFFAQNQLAHLRNEEYWGNHGSPAFLDQLSECPSLEVSRGDRCFHILLKIIGVLLLRIRSSQDSRKAQNVVFRVMPNHGRCLPKESSILQADLDALRNHHDLLCTLYWASPSQYRPRLKAFRDLVDMRSSHRQACHLNILAWSRLVNFQLSIHEPLDNLDGFAEWHSNMLECTLDQHNVARTDGESEARNAGLAGLNSLSRLEASHRLLKFEPKVFHNEFQVEAVIVDALTALEIAVKGAPTNEAAGKLIKQSLVQALRRLELSLRGANNVVLKALNVILAYTQRSKAGSTPKRSQRLNEESQDFGDWSAFEDDETLNDNILQMLEGPLRTLLSNCFGADIVPKDELLTKTVDCYTSLAAVLVHQGHRSWDDYLSPFGQSSWERLRITPQSQKYQVYYLANLLELNDGMFANFRDYFVKIWLTAIVEREVSLKFQFMLTNSVLNAGSEDRLLHNPPFCVDRTSARFSITPNDFLTARLSLITTVLLNMWEGVNEASYDGHDTIARTKQQYKEWLKAMMAAMKANYQELGQGPSMGGAYVEFVQALIQALHKSTSTICPVDKFFMDPREFPPPAVDPAYVMGQLQNYGLRLRDPKIPKQLAAFLQSLSEQAAKGGQQAELAYRLRTAMIDDFEGGDTTNPTLRSFLVKAVIPAYLVVGFSAPGGWVLLLPFLKALQMVFPTLFAVFSADQNSSVASVASILSSYLQSLWASWRMILEDAECLAKRHIQHLLRECYLTVTALLPVLDYIHRLHGTTDGPLKIVAALKTFAIRTLEPEVDNGNFLELGHPATVDAAVDHSFDAVRTFAQAELERSLRSFWLGENSRGQRPYAVTIRECSELEAAVVGLGSQEEEMKQYHEAARGFLDCLEALPSFSTKDRWMSRCRKTLNLEGFTLDDVVI